MAIAGLHNVSAIDSAFLRDSQPEAGRRQDDEGRSGSRASSILQMWRELEDEHLVGQSSPWRERILQHRVDGLGADFSRVSVSDSHSVGHSVNSEDLNAPETEYREWSPSPAGSENGQDDSSDLSEVERERVRQVFRDWMTSGIRERPPGVRGRGNVARAEWLGETEQERVRIIREWVQMNSRHRGARVDRRGEHGAEVGGQIEQVLDGQVINNSEGRSELPRRGIRRLCGRQALLDMVKKAERERKMEIQGLLEHRAVSQFAHRNRIQSLLRGRFLRNDRVIEGETHISRTASELGLLRQRHTVSDLRVGFFSKLDHSLSGQVGSSNESSDSSSNTDSSGDGNDNQNIPGAQTDLNDAECDGYWVLDGRTGIQDADRQGGAHFSDEMSVNISENQGIDRQQAAGTDAAERRSERHEEVELLSEILHDGSSMEFSENVEPNYLLSDREARSLQNQINLEGSATPSFLHDAEVLLRSAPESFHEPVVHTEQLQDDPVVSRSDRRDFAVDRFETFELQGTGTEHVGYPGDSLHSTEQFENVDVSEGDQHGTTTSEWFENENTEEASEVWREDGSFQEAVQSWLEPNDQDDVPIRRMDPFYLPDNDNVHNSELRELLNRRSVSTLLRSGFRQSLDQLIQSYVQRQSHASLDVEMQETSPSPSSGELDPVRSRDQTEDQGDAQQSPPFVLPSPSLPPPQQLWDRESHHYAWPQSDMHPQFGIEWDIINDLRIDMARLQQRMNNMQRTLEACMDMQLELQRSIRQEVSAALNRSASTSGKNALLPAGTSETSFVEDKSKWNDVRKGLCCMCRCSNIDSLLYRCGHMCACSKCANELFQSGGKCPMCWAPVIEVIRAYSIL